jgi:branched-chain amino acid transport system substrate-binding protein
MSESGNNPSAGISRREVLRGGAGLLAGALAPSGLILAARAAENAPLGTYPEGSSGPSVFIGISVPRTGTYAAAGEDLIKGYELAIRHLNEGAALMQRISPNIKKGVLGKEIKHGVADSEAKPNTAVQNFSRFISDNKAILVTGSVSSSEAIANNKLAQREKVIYLPGISASNDTTGKDCVRYSFRECCYAQTAAKALAPQLISTIGRNKKVAYLTPDYSYGHTVQKSMEEYLGEGGWTTVTDQVSPLGTTEFSAYLLNVANSGADVLVNINFGRDAVLSIKQAKQFGVLDKMTLAVPFNTPFLAREVGADTMQGVLAATDYWWTLEERFPLAKMFNDAFRAEYNGIPEWGANTAYMQIAMWADAVERAKSFYPPDVIKAYEAGARIQSTVGEVYFRGADHQLVRPVIIERGRKPAEMRNADDCYQIVEVAPGADLMQAPDAFGCKLGEYI